MRILTLFFALIPSFVFSASPDALIEVDAARVQHPIPRTIYGTFLEPIGRSLYGGLWAQILENPSFEENLWSARRIGQMVTQRPELAQASNVGLPLPWEPLDPDQGWRYEPRWGDSANSARSLLIMALPEKQTGVRQQVFLPVHRVLKYQASLYAKPVSGAREIELSLRKRTQPGVALAKAVVRITANSWTRYEAALELPKGSVASLEPVDFVVAVADEARVLIDQVFLSPADHVEGMNPEMIEMSKALRSPVLRYGGNFTSGYHWPDGIGPLDKRVSMLNQAWGMPEYNHFGTDEFLHFAQLIGSEPQICLNLGGGTPEEAAGWVKYVNGKWNVKGGGLLWELGNELWGNFQIGYPTVARVAGRTKAFSDAVRKTDPRSRLIATGQDPDHFVEWNAAQLGLGPDAFNYLATHFVVGTGDVLRKDAPKEFVAQAGLALPVGLERQLRGMKKQIDADERARDRVKIAFTEWLYSGARDRAMMYDNLGGALCAAGFLNTLMRVADFTPIADMTGLIEFGGIWQKRGRVYGVPAYWAFRMYSTSDGTRLVDTRVKGETYDVEQGVRRIPSIQAVPYLDVTAALNDRGDKLTLYCVNRHLTNDLRASVKLSGFAAAAARGSQLTATDLYTGNNEERPEAVVPVQVPLPNVSGAAFEHVFPRSSVTVIELERSR